MRTIISCIAYKNFDAVKSECKKLETAMNEGLKNHTYGSIKFLTPRFSFISLGAPEKPMILDQNNLSFTVQVHGDKVAEIALAFANELNYECVPADLRDDVIRVLKDKGWIES